MYCLLEIRTHFRQPPLLSIIIMIGLTRTVNLRFVRPTVNKLSSQPPIVKSASPIVLNEPARQHSSWSAFLNRSVSLVTAQTGVRYILHAALLQSDGQSLAKVIALPGYVTDLGRPILDRDVSKVRGVKGWLWREERKGGERVRERER